MWTRITVTYKGLSAKERQTAAKWLQDWTTRGSNEAIKDTVQDAAQDATTGVVGSLTGGASVDWNRLGITVGVFVIGVVLVIMGLVILSKGALTGAASSVVKEVIKK